VTRIRYGGFVFITWIGDHDPRHVHVYRDGKLVLKWDLERGRPLDEETRPSARLMKMISRLSRDGRI
jgi:hypothetical protein